MISSYCQQNCFALLFAVLLAPREPHRRVQGGHGKWLVCSCHATMGSCERKEGGAAMRVTVTIVATGISQARAMHDSIDTRWSIARMDTGSRKRIIYACGDRAMTVISRSVPRFRESIHLIERYISRITLKGVLRNENYGVAELSGTTGTLRSCERFSSYDRFVEKCGKSQIHIITI